MLCLWAALLHGCGSPVPTCDEQVALGDEQLCVRVAEGGVALRKGLVGAPALRANDGMLLRYPVVSKACITMKGMDQPIDALFLGDDGRVLRAACGLEAEAATPVCQPGVLQVLEMAPRGDCATRRGTVVGRGGGLVGPVGVRTLEGKACDGEGEPPAVNGRLHLVVHRSELVSEGTVEALLERAQAYYAPMGLWLTVDEVRELPASFPAEEGAHGGKASDGLLAGNRTELAKRQEAAGLTGIGPDDEAGQAQVDAMVQELVMGRYVELVRRLATEPSPAPERSGPDGRVHVVFLQDIARPGSLGEALFEQLRGLTVSPWLREAGPAESLLELLELPERFTPVAVVGIHPLDKLGPASVDVTLAHELGHALGLPHVEGGGDLMREGVHACVPALRPEQASALRGHERL